MSGWLGFGPAWSDENFRRRLARIRAKNKVAEDDAWAARARAAGERGRRNLAAHHAERGES